MALTGSADINKYAIQKFKDQQVQKDHRGISLTLLQDPLVVFRLVPWKNMLVERVLNTRESLKRSKQSTGSHPNT